MAHDEPGSSLAPLHKASWASEGTALTTEGESWSHTQEAAGSLRHITLPSVAGVPALSPRPPVPRAPGVTSELY